MLIRIALGGLTLLLLSGAETRWPLRARTQPRRHRVAVNLAIGGLAFAAVALVYGTVVLGAISWADGSGVGLVRWLDLPAVAAAPLSIVLLDYTLWCWHWLNHRVPLLWRFHAAHHADLDLDASTALRFHPGELLLSVPFRAAQVVMLGVGFVPLLVWETLVLVFIQFHHANLRLPARVDAALSYAIVTPRMHGIHHSIRRGELHSNFGTLLTVWDHLHRTRVRNVAQRSIQIGLPGLVEGPSLGIGQSLKLPLQRRPPPTGAS
jgi:sterol desaturase/sphingolipid hydroxylase (fatty acid hydroxylase superfamily)